MSNANEPSQGPVALAMLKGFRRELARAERANPGSQGRDVAALKALVDDLIAAGAPCPTCGHWHPDQTANDTDTETLQ